MKQLILLITLTFTFNSFLIAQDANKAFYEIDNGLRLSVDIIRPILTFTQKNYTGYEFSADVGIKPKLRLSIDLGTQTKFNNDNSFDYNTKGNYFKIGVDRNFMNFENSVKDIFSVGLRYGIGFMNHSIDNVSIFDSYWGNVNIPSKNENFTAHWTEVVVGMKTPIFKNISMGWDIRAKLLIIQNNTFSTRPYIPGFGQPSDGKNVRTSMSFHYYIAYQIPFKRKMIWDVPQPKKEVEND